MPEVQVTQHPEPTALYGGDFPRRYMTVAIAAGTALEAGAVLGEVTASGEFQLSLAAASDGSETPSAVLVHDIDDAATSAEVLISGDVRGSALHLGTGHTVATARAALRAYSIFVQ